MSVTEPANTSIEIETTRFGMRSVGADEVIEFPHGLVGLPGNRYVLLQERAGALFSWLQSLSEPALALPLIDPRLVRPDYSLVLTAGDREALGLKRAEEAAVYATVSARPEPNETTVNLRAPILIIAGRGFQVVTDGPDSDLRVPLARLAAAETAA
jgi:flagellar assembly factor FliW